MYTFKTQLILAFLCVNFMASAQDFGTGYTPMPEEEYEKLGIAFSSASSTFKSRSLPSSYVIPEEYFPVARSQGNMGSCVGWATGYALASFYFSAKNKWGKPENSSQIMSPAFVYHDVRTCNSCNCGSYIPYALDLLTKKGVVPWKDMPYSDQSCQRPDQRLYSIAAGYKMDGWNRLIDKVNFREFKEHLSNDVPVVIGSLLGENFSSYGYKKTGDPFKCTQLSANTGHAMLVVGYDDNKQAFKIMNSWGSNWGVNGYIWVDYDCFKLMMSSYGGEAYVINKDYTLSKDDSPNVNPSANISASSFQPYGHWEQIRTGHYYIDYGLKINPNVQHLVNKVTYVYDHASFSNKYITVTEGPHYKTAYEGPYCLPAMTAVVYLNDGKSVRVDFNGCEILEQKESHVDLNTLEINPIVTAVPQTGKQGFYRFEIRLRGTEQVKDRILKVVYDYNHPSFSNRFITVTSKNDGFKTSYNGWGCLQGMKATIYFDNNTTQTYNINMCQLLGW